MSLMSSNMPLMLLITFINIINNVVNARHCERQCNSFFLNDINDSFATSQMADFFVVRSKFA